MKLGIKASSFVVVAMLLPSVALALPFNTDLYHGQPLTGEVMRPKAKDSIPMGALARRVESKEVAASLENPILADALSVTNGERLFAINCTPCHGNFADGKQVSMGPVAKYMPGPDLTAQLYKDRNDGFFYGTIHFGGMALMPAYGYKLSPTEHWDIVNYIRKFQNGK
jgi:mono/diheme cytochrome c family protein